MKAASSLVRLVSWNDEIARQHSQEISQLGYRVEASSLHGTSAYITHFSSLSPAIVLIDLDRLPSHGREVAIVLRRSKTTRHIPIVFAGGLEEKVARLHSELPDAVFTSWKQVKKALKQAITSPPIAPVHPVPHMQRWSHSSLTRKLGIFEKMDIALIGDMDGEIAEIIGELPEDAVLGSRITETTRLVLYVAHSLRETLAEVHHAQAHLPEGASFWIIHRKSAAKQRSDFNQNDVREAGLDGGFVDYKVCSVNSQWSGLKFARKKR
ncbi:hypothetical protein [Acidobacterium sp. S8]|uniref:hypothetical protein n=1 Tax=Acidobacterium sp. S8 TaxID=1641854 RepID=UPI00131C6E29|nr:hypothetical protein [Acidobacterium sp. S8]